MKKQGKTVLITGGGTGIGLAIAKEFVKNDNTVIITGRRLSKLEDAKKEIPDLHIIQNDVTDEAQIKTLVQRTQNEFGGIDVLINNAGVQYAFDINKETNSIEKQLMEINIDFAGPVRMVHFFLPQLKQSDEPVIVNVSSGLAFIPMTKTPVYSATKAALHSWTQSIRLQLKESKIHVMELMPPVVETQMTDATTGVPKISTEKLAASFWKAYSKNKKEITPGISKALKIMRRLAPAFVFRQLNKQAVPE